MVQVNPPLTVNKLQLIYTNLRLPLLGFQQLGPDGLVSLS